MFKCDNKCSCCDKCIIKILELQLENERLKNKLYEKLFTESSSSKKTNTITKHSSSPVFTSLLSSSEFNILSATSNSNSSSIFNSILNSCSVVNNVSNNNVPTSTTTSLTGLSPQIVGSSISTIPELELSEEDCIENVFKSIETSRQYVLKLDEIKEYRKKRLGKINVFKYIDLVISHNSRLQKIADIKNHDKRKTRDIISKTLTPLESRLIFFDGYTNSQIDIDDLKKFETSVSLLNNETHFIPFKHQDFIKHFKTYGMALMDIKDYFEKLICNPHKYFNLIYVSNNPKSTLADPYTFYYLDKIDTEKNNKKSWKMICRLEDLTNDIIDSALVFCIQTAKQIYRDVFCDNSYRRDFASKSVILSSDFMQLFYNLLLLTHPIKFCKTIQTIVINNCGYIPNADNDKFNLTADDKVQQKKFTSGNSSLPKDHYYHLVQQIFDDIQIEDIDHFLSKFEF
jgi:hypothetical protein